MSTATRPLITKPRKSQLLLEGTATLISLAMLLWLFLWFLYQQPDSLRVQAYHVPISSDFAPYLESDVRGISQVEGVESVKRIDLAGLQEKMSLSASGSGSPLVVSMSAPRVPGLQEWEPLDLVKKVAKDAKRDVLLVLDAAQVDTERDLGVFGNSPYLKLAEGLEAIETPPNVNVFVLTSCAPGQKSWTIDGAGRSAFSYFVQLGLSGDAKPVEGGARKTSMNIDDLHRFVLQNTQRWAKQYRRGAVQTPRLLKVGRTSAPFSLPPFQFKKPTAPSTPVVAKAEGPALKDVVAKEAAPKEAAPKEVAAKPADVKAEAGANPRVALLDSLLDEWKQHERLDDPDRHPSRAAPARWRAYESKLLRAERQVRASWNDPGMVEGAGIARDEAVRQRESLEVTLKRAETQESNFPFHPASLEPEGREALNASLKYVTAHGLDELASSTRSPVQANSAVAGTAKVPLEPAVEILPPALDLANHKGPERYLELQLPAWALRFHDTFGVEAFKVDRRGGLLRDSVRARLPAEAALAVDRRGLSWVEAAIRKGDEARRAIQDELFALPDQQDEYTRLRDRISDYGKDYLEAKARIDLFHRSRSLFERVAARLPYYGEWAVLDRTKGPIDSESTGDDSPAPQLTDLIQHTADLGRELRKSPDPKDLSGVAGRASDLSAATDRTSEDLAKLEGIYQNAVNKLTLDDSSGWRDLDDILATPLIPTIDRKVLLNEILRIESDAPEAMPSTTGEGGAGDLAKDPEVLIDPSFAKKAIGMARLDLALRRLGLGDRSDGTEAEGINRLENSLRAINLADAAKVDVSAAGNVLEGFAKVGSMARQLSSDSSTRRGRPGRDAKGTEAKVFAEFWDVDRDVRFRNAGELNRARAEGDQATSDLDAFARRVSLRFHTERLAQDFARPRELESLNALARQESGDAPPVNYSKGYLATTLPAGGIEIDRERRSTLLPVAVKSEDERESEKIPSGRAFVGVMKKSEPKPAGTPTPGPPKEEARLQVSLPRSTLDLGQNFAGGLFGINEGTQEPLSFLVKQMTNAEFEGVKKSLLVKVFYRGRVDEEGQKKQVEVVCHDFGPKILVKILEDREALALRYSATIANTIPDQFAEHPNVGYLHCKGFLSYLLRFRNATDSVQEIVIEQTWTNSARGGGKPMLSGLIRLNPGMIHNIPDTLRSPEFATEPTKQLTVRVLDARTKEEVIPPEIFAFKQLKLEDYIAIDKGRVDFNFKGDGILLDCFEIILTRLERDPVTLPIFFNDILFYFDEIQSPNELDKSRILGRNGRIWAHQPLGPGMKAIKWRISVEREERTDTDSLR